MKILHVIDSGGMYGAEVMLLNLVEEQLRLGLQPVIASIGDPHIVTKPLELEAVRRGVRVEPFRMRPGPNLLGALNVVRFAGKENFDLFHSHGYKANILLGMLPRSIRKLPVISTVHGWTSTRRMSKIALYEWVDALILRFIERVVLVNKAMWKKVRLRNLSVVNNGIPLCDENYGGGSEEQHVPLDRDIVGFCRGGFTVGAIGRLSKEKGFDVLLEAVKMVSATCHNVRLVVIGEGSEREELEARAKKLGIADVVMFPGYRDQASRYLACFDIFALSSLTEGLPLVILEAMRAGVPIIATRVGGVPEVLANGQAGVLVGSSDSPALSEGISALIENPGLRSRLAEYAQRLVAEKYSSTRMAEEYQSIYRSMMRPVLEVGP